MEVMMRAWQWSGQDAWKSSVLHALGAFVTSSGFGGIAAVVAAVIAYRGVRKAIAADKEEQRRRERLDAMYGALAAVNIAKHQVWQRNVAVAERAYGPVKDNLNLFPDWMTHPAASRHSDLRAARGRLTLAGLDTTVFDEVHRLINEAANRGYEGAKRSEVQRAEDEATEAIKRLADSFGLL
jgi:hypothetical protein